MHGLDDAGFTTLIRANRLASLVPWLAEASVRLGDEARMQALHAELLPLAGRNISLQLRVCFGPAALFLGMIAGGLGRSDEAVAHFDAAQALAARMSGRPLLALIQVERARVLAAIGALDAAAEALRAARQAATELALGGLIGRIEDLEAALTGAAQTVAQAAVDAVDEVAIAAGNRGRVVPFPRRRTEPPPTATTGQSQVARREADRSRLPSATLRREGRLWTIAAGGTVVRCPHTKGLLYLAHLLAHPGKSFHALELVALERPEGGEAAGVEIDARGFRVGPPQVGEPLADAKALAAYRRRLGDLSEELAEATGFNDLARAACLQEEIDGLTQILASTLGLGGRARVTGSFAERARLNVTRAIRSAIQRIAEGHADLAQHLAARIRTGTFCGYAPKPDDSVRWEL